MPKLEVAIRRVDVVTGGMYAVQFFGVIWDKGFFMSEFSIFLQ